MADDYSYGDGHTSVSLVDGGEFRARLDDHERLRTEWMRGAAFLDFVSVHGGAVTVKGARVDAITAMTADTIERWRAQRAEEKQADARHGLD